MDFGPLKLKHCRYGWMLFTGPYIGKCFDLYGEYSESEVFMMRQFVRPGGTVVDVGANIGDLTVPLAHMVGRDGSVIAVESNQQLFQVLCANLALNQIGNVKPVQAFVKMSEMAPVRDDFVAGKFGYDTIVIDDLNLESCQLIKIDVDGNELDVLQSAEATIRQFQPILYFENDRKEKSKALLSHTLDLGYSLYWHRAPIFLPNNFFGNPVNHWAPKDIISIMVIGTPPGWKGVVKGLPRIKSPDDWWEKSDPT